MKKILMFRVMLAVMALSLFATSCKDDETPPSGVVASFQFEQDADDFHKVKFTNFSQHFASVSWNFGDGSAATSEENPTHSFATAGTYTVTLTATGSDGVTSEKSLDVAISDPDIETRKLTGDASKTWKLLRDPSTGVYPLQVGPKAHSTIWWASGLQEEIGIRPCLFNDEYVFTLDGKKMEYKTNGDLWRDTDVWATGGCVDTTDPDAFKNKNDEDISAWGDGVHTFDYNAANKTLTVSGTGAFLGLTKAGSTAIVTTPQASVVYKVISLVDSDVDTLTVETTYDSDAAYWRFVLVHYDDPSDEPAIPGAAPIVGFSYEVNAKEVTFTNTSGNADSYSWNFGDDATSSEESPVHTYTSDGSYDVTLTATNAQGESSVTKSVVVSSSTLTNEILNGGGSKIWKLKPAAGSFVVGEGKGASNWFSGGNFQDESNPAGNGGYRPCLANDEFIFKTGDVYQYDAKSDVYVEDYWLAGATGCADESTITGNASIWTSGTHTYSFTAASGDSPATITVSGLGAFIALPKAYNGGEYSPTASESAPNPGPPTVDTPVTYEVLSYVNDGTTETLQITVHIAGNGYWTFTLVSQ
jgi:PKD repeat protein